MMIYEVLGESGELGHMAGRLASTHNLNGPWYSKISEETKIPNRKLSKDNKTFGQFRITIAVLCVMVKRYCCVLHMSAVGC
jgi:hypothetical protein